MAEERRVQRGLNDSLACGLEKGESEKAGSDSKILRERRERVCVGLLVQGWYSAVLGWQCCSSQFPERGFDADEVFPFVATGQVLARCCLGLRKSEEGSLVIAPFAVCVRVSSLHDVFGTLGPSRAENRRCHHRLLKGYVGRTIKHYPVHVLASSMAFEYRGRGSNFGFSTG